MKILCELELLIIQNQTKNNIKIEILVGTITKYVCITFLLPLNLAVKSVIVKDK